MYPEGDCRPRHLRPIGPPRKPPPTAILRRRSAKHISENSACQEFYASKRTSLLRVMFSDRTLERAAEEAPVQRPCLYAVPAVLRTATAVIVEASSANQLCHRSGMQSAAGTSGSDPPIVAHMKSWLLQCFQTQSIIEPISNTLEKTKYFGSHNNPPTTHVIPAALSQVKHLYKSLSSRVSQNS